MLGSWGEGWLGVERVVVLICSPKNVASFGVAVWGLGLGSWMDSAVLMSSAAFGLIGVAYAHNPGVCMPCGVSATPRTGRRMWLVRVGRRCPWRRSPRMSSHLCCQVCVWSLGAR